KLLAQILQNKSEKADKDQKLSLKKHQLEIEEPELPKLKKFEAVTDFT
ncbi:6220_t:CDS:2, partial [Funneliformis mosseae]